LSSIGKVKHFCVECGKKLDDDREMCEECVEKKEKENAQKQFSDKMQDDQRLRKLANKFSKYWVNE
jgi:predicted amidophosphoribosyltransferase